MTLRGEDPSSSSAPTGEPGTEDHEEPETINRYTGTGVSALLIGIFAVLVLAVVFLAQNTESVPIRFFGFDTNAPIFVIVLVTVVASSISTLLVAELWRRRRRRQRAEREELARLRRGHSG